MKQDPQSQGLNSTEPRVTLYTTAWCGYCRAAKSLLNSRGIAYRDIDVTTDAALRRSIAAQTGWPTVPVVLIDGKLIGGFDNLAELDADGSLGEIAS